MARTARDAPGTTPSDEELLNALADDPSALGTLYDRYGGLVYGLAHKVLANPDEAADLTQEVFLHLQSERKYDPARGTLGSFLATLTRSRAIDKLRARTRSGRILREVHRAAPPPERDPTPVERLAVAQSSERVRAAMATLGESERRALELAYYQGLTQTEIAEELGAPLGTVKSWCRRGLLAMKQALGDLVETG